MRLAKEVRKKVRDHINEGFTDALKAAFVEAFPPLKLETSYDILAMALISRRADEQDFTPEQKAFVTGFEAGYMAALEPLEDSPRRRTEP